MRFRLYTFLGAALAAGLAGAADPVSKAVPEPPPAASRPDRPVSVDELKAIQEQVKVVTDKVIPVTVCLQVGAASGSGVIVSEDGLILTAGHVVAGKPGRQLTVVMPDGKRYKGKVLGFDPKVDSGMAQLTEPGPNDGKWPYAEIAPSKDVKGGQWVIATGHPGGFKVGRPPVVRVGRIGRTSMGTDGSTFLQTDTTLVGGDSGGPLWDMHGRVIGIHSRIGQPINQNLDVPSDKYTEAWDALKSETVLHVTPYLGVSMEEGAKDCKLGRVTPGGPAATAGLKAQDVVLKFAGKEVETYDDMVKLLKEQKPYAEVTVVVRREVKKDDKDAKKDEKTKKDGEDKDAKKDDSTKKDDKPKTETQEFKVTIGYRPE
jgi:serine protease Do